MKRFLTFLLSLSLLIAFAGCRKPYKQPTAPQAIAPVEDVQGAEILAQRRDQAESYMRQMATVMWRASEDITYSNNSNSVDPTSGEAKDLIYIRAGRLYRGLPYSHAAGGPNAFLEYAGEQDENGIYTISGLTWHPLNGANKTARVGNDCASAVGLSWGTLGNSLAQDSSTKYMTTKYGYLRVGEYESNDDAHTYTLPVCEANGYDKMAAAYAQLQKADAVVRRNKNDSNGHAMMVVSVHVEKTAEGLIDGVMSYITVLEQTSGTIEAERCHYDAELGENVYETYLIDNKYTFFDLYSAGYLPITCKELIDPSPVEPESVSDSLAQPSIDSIFDGNLTATRFLESVTISITDVQENVVQICTASPTNRQLYHFDMQTFVTDRPEVLRGKIDLSTLPAGTYTCRLTCRLITGTEVVVRNFTFTI